MHSANLRRGQGFKFQKTRQAKDHILEIIFDPESEKKHRATDYQVKTPFQIIYKQGQQMDQAEMEVQKYNIHKSYNVGETLTLSTAKTDM